MEKKKSPQPPMLPEPLEPCDSLEACIQTVMETDLPVTGFRIRTSSPGCQYSGLQFSGIYFERCRLAKTIFHQCSFTDTVFQG